MRPSQLRLVAVGGVLAVAIGVATAFVVGRDGPAFDGRPIVAAVAAGSTNAG